MKLKTTIISDTHNKHDGVKLLGGDLLIHCGDSCGVGNTVEFHNFIEWFAKQDYTHKVLIAGNHDCCLDENHYAYDEFTKFTLKYNQKGITYLENTGVVIEGLKIWGSPITPNFYEERWAFNKTRGDEIGEVWDEIPSDTDILITHGPAFSYLDFTTYGDKNVGCEELYKTVVEVEPMIHCFGHIHHSYGNTFNGKTDFINASTCNESYKPTNSPVNLIIDTENKTLTYGF